MLARAAGWLKPGGTLVYSVCSLEPEEGEQVVEPSSPTARLRARSDRAGELPAEMRPNDGMAPHPARHCSPSRAAPTASSSRASRE
jgi:16S rRNA C967 or C1407 C5-methylase (RsmB/RsmF family)